MTDENIALCLFQKDDLRLCEKPIPEPGPGQLQVSMKRVGICGSDVKFWVYGSLGPFTLDGNPVVMGHEGSGQITKVGAGVKGYKVGDRVAIEPAIPCRMCRFCKGGRYNLCKDVKGLATPGVDGHISRYFVMDADFCHKLPEHVSYEEGALLEPLVCAIHGTNRSGVKMGDSVLICGAGPIGVLVMLVCKARGCVQITLTDIDDKRLEFAKSLGADFVVNVKGMSPQEAAGNVEELMGDKVDVAFECTGVTAGISTAIYAAQSGGVAFIVGMGKMDHEVPLGEAGVREVDIKFMFRYANCYPTAIAMVSSGLINVKPLITHRYDIMDAVEAFRVAKSGEGVKIMINCEKKGLQ